MHHGDDQATMDDELRELRGAAIRVTTMPKEELRQVAELRDGEIRSKRGLLALLPNNADT